MTPNSAEPNGDGRFDGGIDDSLEIDGSFPETTLEAIEAVTVGKRRKMRLFWLAAIASGAGFFATPQGKDLWEEYDEHLLDLDEREWRSYLAKLAEDKKYEELNLPTFFWDLEKLVFGMSDEAIALAKEEVKKDCRYLKKIKEARPKRDVLNALLTSKFYSKHLPGQSSMVRLLDEKYPKGTAYSGLAKDSLGSNCFGRFCLYLTLLSEVIPEDIKYLKMDISSQSKFEGEIGHISLYLDAKALYPELPEGERWFSLETGGLEEASRPPSHKDVSIEKAIIDSFLDPNATWSYRRGVSFAGMVQGRGTTGQVSKLFGDKEKLNQPVDSGRPEAKSVRDSDLVRRDNVVIEEYDAEGNVMNTAWVDGCIDPPKDVSSCRVVRSRRLHSYGGKGVLPCRDAIWRMAKGECNENSPSLSWLREGSNIEEYSCKDAAEELRGLGGIIINTSQTGGVYLGHLAFSMEKGQLPTVSHDFACEIGDGRSEIKYTWEFETQGLPEPIRTDVSVRKVRVGGIPKFIPPLGSRYNEWREGKKVNFRGEKRRYKKR